MSDQSDPLSADERFDIAVAAHESGDLPVAEREYRQILGENPDDPVVLHLLGSILTTTGRVVEGVPLLERSVDIDPESGPAWAQLALARMQGAQPDAAIDAWGRAWTLDADTVSHLAATFAPLLEARAEERPGYWQLAGEARLVTGQADLAETDFRNAISHAPTEDAARTSLGTLLLMKGESKDAIAVLSTNLTPGLASTVRRVNLAQAHLIEGNPGEAILVLEDVRAQEAPEIRAVASTRVNALLRLGMIGDAEIAVASGLSDLPNDPILALLASDIDRRQGRFASAIHRLQSAVEAHASNDRLRVRLAELLIESGSPQQALSLVDQSDVDEAADPWPLLAAKAASLAMLGRREDALRIVRSSGGVDIDSAVRLELARTAVVRCKDIELGESVLRATLASDPHCIGARRELSRLLLAAGLHRDALAVLDVDPGTTHDPECRSLAWRCRIQLGEQPPPADWDSVIAAGSAFASDISDMLLTSQYADQLDERWVADLHRDWQRCLPHGEADCAEAWARPTRKRTGRSLRIGFLSADLRRHAVAFFLSDWIEKVDRSRLECIAYSVTRLEDQMTSLLKSRFAEWRDVRSCTASQFRDQVRHDEIDILMELGGHTANNPLELLHPRSAPMQISWLGYPNTTGLDAIDFRLVDNLTDPEGHPWHGTETLLRMQPPFLCYGPPRLDLVTDATNERPPTFGSFNNLQKISDRTVQLWASTVRAVPGARLLLKGRGFETRLSRARFSERFLAAGLEPDRLHLVGPDNDLPSHLARYRDIDVALDPFPYHGTTTTCEALWMGVPVVSRIGKTHRSRVGLTLLRTVGLQSLCADTDEDFVEAASTLIQERHGHLTSRDLLRERLESSELCSPESFATRFTEAIERAWAESTSRP